MGSPTFGCGKNVTERDYQMWHGKSRLQGWAAGLLSLVEAANLLVLEADACRYQLHLISNASF